jgi:hypothetical protein
MVGAMSDNEPTAEQPAEQPAAPPAPQSASERAATQTPLRDHLFGLRSVLAVGLAGVVLGGLGGFGIHAATDGDGDGRMGRFGPGGGFQDGRGGPGGFPQGPGQQGPGQQGPGQQGGPMGPGGQAPQLPQASPTPSQDS